MAVEKETQFEAWLDENMQGGNPNYIETIEGTLENPMPGGGWSALCDDILAGNATVNGMLNMGGTNAAFNIVPSGDTVVVYGVASSIRDSLSSSTAATFNWDSDGIIMVANSLQNGQVVDLLAMASYIQTTLTIIHHPLPEN